MAESSVIAGMEYDAGARVLLVRYRGRGVYQYFEVPAAVWAAFQAAESKGTYLNEVFKGMGFAYRRGNGPVRRPVRRVAEGPAEEVGLAERLRRAVAAESSGE